MGGAGLLEDFCFFLAPGDRCAASGLTGFRETRKLSELEDFFRADFLPGSSREPVELLLSFCIGVTGIRAGLGAGRGGAGDVGDLQTGEGVLDFLSR